MGNFVPFRFDLEIKVNSCYFFYMWSKMYTKLQQFTKNEKKIENYGN